MLETTLAKNTKDVYKILKKVHNEKTAIKDFHSHITLEFIVKYAYFDAQSTYDIKQEDTKGKEYVDFIFYPKHNNENKTVIILELRVGESAKEAIDQIYKINYYMKLKGLGYRVLLVGINYNNNKKTRNMTA